MSDIVNNYYINEPPQDSGGGDKILGIIPKTPKALGILAALIAVGYFYGDTVKSYAMSAAAQFNSRNQTLIAPTRLVSSVNPIIVTIPSPKKKQKKVLSEAEFLEKQNKEIEAERKRFFGHD